MNNPMMAMLQQLKANPIQMLARRFNVPQNLHSPEDILNHLIQSRQVSQEQLNNAYQMARQFRK